LSDIDNITRTFPTILCYSCPDYVELEEEVPPRIPDKRFVRFLERKALNKNFFVTSKKIDLEKPGEFSLVD
jgi:hypothetical protein